MTTPLNELETQLAALREEATKAIAAADTLEQLEQLRVSYLGKKGQLSGILRGMGKLTPEDRPRIGALANVVKELLQDNLEQKRSSLQAAQIQAQLEAETLDVTMPGVYRPQGRLHPLNSTIDRALDVFVGLGYTVA
ncbi:MAG TPA: phenylalanine--tRNA ligase subunit alpha, partial [Candidatus Sericytochromatia bacterium]